jgi:hypothetical protein
VEVITRIIASYTSYLENGLKEFEPQRVQNIRDTLKTLVNAVQQKRLVDSTTKNS